MTMPTRRPGALSRARASFAKTSPTHDYSPVRRGSLLAALVMTATVALVGSSGVASAHGAAASAPTASAAECGDTAIFVTRPGRWNCNNLYMARVALDGRFRPGGRKVKTDHVKAGEWVSIRCQIYAFDENGNRAGLFDKVGDYYVPDKYMRTLFTGRIPRSPVCPRPHPQP
jgi:hypothetical protein